MWGRTNFIWVGQNFSENYCPSTKIFRKFLSYSRTKKLSHRTNFLSENFCPIGQFFRTKIPVTDVDPIFRAGRYR